MKTLSFFMLFVALGVGVMFAAPEWSEAQCGTRCMNPSDYTMMDVELERERERDRWLRSQAHQLEQRRARAEMNRAAEKRYWDAAESWGNFSAGGAILGEPMGGKIVPGARNCMGVPLNQSC